MLALLLVACTPWEGTWIVHLRNTTDASFGESDEVVRFYTLSDGGAAAEIEGLILVGEVSSPSFELSQASSTVTTTGGCASTVENRYDFTGDFGGDLGLAGQYVFTSASSFQGCEGAVDSETRLVYEATGVQLDAKHDEHPRTRLSWGYL